MYEVDAALEFASSLLLPARSFEHLKAGQWIKQRTSTDSYSYALTPDLGQAGSSYTVDFRSHPTCFAIASFGLP